MTRIFKEEEFSEEDWDDVFHISLATFKWLSENVKSEYQINLEKDSSNTVSSHRKTKKQKD